MTVLATCGETSPVALITYQTTLVDACLDLLSLENAKRFSAEQERRSRIEDKDEAEERVLNSGKVDETPLPLATTSTHASLRRGALLFISLLIRAQPDAFSNLEHRRLIQRCRAVVGYVEATDDDGLVRYNAGVVKDDLEAL